MSFFGDLLNKVKSTASSMADSVANATGMKNSAVGPNVGNSLKNAGLPPLARESPGITMTGGRRRRRGGKKHRKTRRRY